jgi:hypothetical protein
MNEGKLRELWEKIFRYIQENQVSIGGIQGGKKRKSKSKQRGGNIKDVAFAIYDAFITTLLILVVMLKLAQNPDYEKNIDNLIQNPEEVINLAVEPEMQQALVLVKNARPTIQNANMPSSQDMLVFLRDALHGIGMKELNRALLSRLPLSKKEKAGYKRDDLMRQALKLAEFANDLRTAAKQSDIGGIENFYPEIEKIKFKKSDALVDYSSSTPSLHGREIIRRAVGDEDAENFSFGEVYSPYSDRSLLPTNTYNDIDYFRQKRESRKKLPVKELADEETDFGMAPENVPDFIEGGKRKRNRKTKRRKRRTQKRRSGKKTRRYY